MTPEEELLVYRQELKVALIAYMDGDLEAFEKWRRKWPDPERDSVPPQAIEAGVMKAVTGITDMPMAYRTRAKRWLLLRGMASEDDGEVPVDGEGELQ